MGRTPSLGVKRAAGSFSFPGQWIECVNQTVYQIFPSCGFSKKTVVVFSHIFPFNASVSGLVWQKGKATTTTFIVSLITDKPKDERTCGWHYHYYHHPNRHTFFGSPVQRRDSFAHPWGLNEMPTQLRRAWESINWMIVQTKSRTHVNKSIDLKLGQT